MKNKILVEFDKKELKKNCPVTDWCRTCEKEYWKLLNCHMNKVNYKIKEPIMDSKILTVINHIIFTEIFNRVTLGNIIEDDLIFSDRYFLSQQIYMDLLNQGINVVPEQLYYICVSLA